MIQHDDGIACVACSRAYIYDVRRQYIRTSGAHVFYSYIWARLRFIIIITRGDLLFLLCKTCGDHILCCRFCAFLQRALCIEEVIINMYANGCVRARDRGFFFLVLRWIARVSRTVWDSTTAVCSTHIILYERRIQEKCPPYNGGRQQSGESCWRLPSSCN